VTIAIITVSRGRLHHLRETLPLLSTQGADQLIVVDYGCPDGSGDWAERHHPGVTVVRVSDDPGFCLARARNAGAQQAKTDWLLFVDADILTAAGWVDWMRGALRPGHFYVCEPGIDGRDPDLCGTILCPRRDFEAIGGYDEAIRGWAGEDFDLVERLQRRGVAVSTYPLAFVDPIRHGDEQRPEWHGNESRSRRLVIVRCYREAKRAFSQLLGITSDLPLPMRNLLMSRTQGAVERWFDAGSRGPLEIRYELDALPAAWLPPPFRMTKDFALTLHVGRSSDVSR
jgi:GT2 family glycosyltransferase